MPLGIHVIPCTPQARELLRKVLSPHPILGLGHQEIMQGILEHFPEEKSTVSFRETPIGENGPQSVLNHDHPIRSMRYIKRIVLPTMKEDHEVEQIRLIRGSMADEPRTDTIISKLFGKETTTGSYPMSQSTEWRWRLIPEDKTIELRRLHKKNPTKELQTELPRRSTMQRRQVGFRGRS